MTKNCVVLEQRKQWQIGEFILICVSRQAADIPALAVAVVKQNGRAGERQERGKGPDGGREEKRESTEGSVTRRGVERERARHSSVRQYFDGLKAVC